MEDFVFQISRRASLFLPSLGRLVFCFVVPLVFVLKVSLVVVVLLEAVWDLGNGKHFVILVLIFETVISHSFELFVLYNI